MDWNEDQRRKLLEDYKSGNITTEEYDEMVEALDKFSDNRSQGKTKKSVSVKAIVSVLTVIACLFMFVYIFSYFSNKDSIVTGVQSSLSVTGKGISDSDFINICQNGSPQQIIDAVKKGANVKARVKRITPLLAVASNRKSNPEVITVLVNAGADINAAGEDRSTPLILAAKNSSNPNVITTLLYLGARPNATDNFEKMAIDYIRENENLKDTEALWNLSSVPVLRSKDVFFAMNNSEFIEFCRTGSPQQINDAIANGANVNARDKGLTPLMAAAESNSDPEVIAALITAGADANATNVSGLTPLMLAAGNNPNPEVIAAIIKAGADVNPKTGVNTPLMTAASDNNNSEVVTVLIKAGANVNAKNALERTPLLLAARNNSNPEVIKNLIKAGANVNVKDADGKTPLIMATENRNPHPEMITTLINAGADINARDKFGLTPLMSAAGNDNSNPEVITAIVKTETSPGKAGVNINSLDENGRTPLIEAARNASNPQVIITLLQLGANPKIRDDFGKIAIDYARENRMLINTEALQKLQRDEFIVQQNAPNSTRPAMSDYSFLELCKSGSLQQINNAIKNGANVNASNIRGETALMLAAGSNTNSEVLTALMNAGANINAKNNQGNTPFDYVMRNRRLINSAAARTLQGRTTVSTSGSAQPGANTVTIRGRTSTPLASEPRAAMSDYSFVELCRESSLVRIREAISNRANINAVGDIGTTPLMAAASSRNSNPDVIRTLIGEGANVNTRDYLGRTALILAADNTNINPQVLTILLDYRANTRIRDNAGNMAIDYANRNRSLRNTTALRRLAAASP